MWRLALTALLIAAEPDGYSAARETMIRDIEQETRATARWTGKERLSAEVTAAMRATPRHLFVPALMRPFAYANHPLPIGHGQTISQPFIVAIMTELAQPSKSARVLEVGTGSGYQAAVLAKLVAEVYTVEIVPELAKEAAGRLRDLGYGNVHVRAGDGYQGWPQKAPFDIIIITAAAPQIPAPLIQQLAVGGRLVGPIGPVAASQDMVLAVKRRDGSLIQSALFPVRFVPLTRDTH